jgi:hypothetical protein
MWRKPRDRAAVWVRQHFPDRPYLERDEDPFGTNAAEWAKDESGRLMPWAGPNRPEPPPGFRYATMPDPLVGCDPEPQPARDTPPGETILAVKGPSPQRCPNSDGLISTVAGWLTQHQFRTRRRRGEIDADGNYAAKPFASYSGRWRTRAEPIRAVETKDKQGRPSVVAGAVTLEEYNEALQRRSEAEAEAARLRKVLKRSKRREARMEAIIGAVIDELTDSVVRATTVTPVPETPLPTPARALLEELTLPKPRPPHDWRYWDIPEET